MTSTSKELIEASCNIIDVISYDIEQYKDIADLCNICRLCGIQFESCQMTPIFSNISVDLELKIKEVVNIELLQGDGLPQNICTFCASKLNQAHDFIKRSFAFDNFLKNTLFQDVSEIVLPVAIKEELADIAFIEDSEQGGDTVTEPTIKPKLEKTTKRELEIDAGTENTAEPSNKKGLRNRQATHHCTKCQVTFNSFPLYNFHLLEECTKEGKTRFQQRKKKRPKPSKRQSNKLSPSNLCHVCNGDFPSFQKLVAHRNLCFKSKYPHECDTCGMTFHATAARVLHTIVVHKKRKGDDETYECVKCSETFADLPDFIGHLYRHAARQPFQCFICGNHNHEVNKLKRHLAEHDFVLPKATRKPIPSDGSSSEFEVI